MINDLGNMIEKPPCDSCKFMRILGPNDGTQSDAVESRPDARC